MADGKGKSGRPINPFEEMSMSNEKKVDKTKKDPKKEKWDKIEKGVSESKRGDLKSAIKEDVKTNASKKRRRPRRRNKISEAKPIDNKNIIEQKEKVVQPVEQVDKQQVDKQQVDNQQAAPVNPFGEMAQQAPPAQEQRPPIQEQKPVEPVKKKVAVDSPVVPETPPEPDPFTNEVANSNNQPSVNPFDAVPQQPVDLPPKEYEERYEEEVKSESNDSNESQEKTAEFQKVESVGDEAPVNPFAPPSSQPSTVDAKALETTPFDLRDDGVEEVKKEEKDEDPEEIKHAEEQMSPSNETPFGDSGGEQEVKEEVKDTPSAEVSEVVEVKPEDGPSDIPVTVPTEQEIEASSSDKNEVEEFKEEFWDILEQAGFTKQRIITIIVVVILGIVALVGWGKGWFDFSSDNSDVTVKVQEVQEEPAEKEPIEEASNNKDVVVKSSYAVEDQVKPLLIGRSTSGVYRGALSGIEVAFSVGGLDQTFDDKVTYYIDLIRKMENMYATDVYALIDRAVDRRLVLENHLKEMDAIIDEGNSAYNAVVAAMNRFDAQFEVNAASKSVYEEQFFANISALLPTSSHNSLEAFIELSKESVELKAQFNAYEIIRDMLGASLDALEPRYRDIESNVGALIKGIRVFDIPHSDIEAIVPVEN